MRAAFSQYWRAAIYLDHFWSGLLSLMGVESCRQSIRGRHINRTFLLVGVVMGAAGLLNYPKNSGKYFIYRQFLQAARCLTREGSSLGTGSAV